MTTFYTQDAWGDNEALGRYTYACARWYVGGIDDRDVRLARRRMAEQGDAIMMDAPRLDYTRRYDEEYLDQLRAQGVI